MVAICVALTGAITVLIRPGLLRDRVERAGGTLVFQGRDDTGYGIFTMDLGSGKIRHLPVPIPRSVGFPRYSPDGEHLAFVAASDDGIEDLYIAGQDGSNPRIVAASPGEPEGAPAWSPDGSTIAFSSRRDGNWEIYTVRPDGTELRRLTRDEAFDAAPVWAPDGSGMIAFASDRGGVDSHLYLMAHDGSGVRRLTFGDDEGSPDWSPDGRRIVYAGFSSGNADIWTIEADGSGARRLTRSEIFEYTPRWSPDGRWIAFEGYLGDAPDIFVMRPDGSASRRLTPTGRYSGSPAWRPLPPV
jgi:TolB protein